MANRAASIKQADLTRYVKGVVAAGVSISRIEIDPRNGHVIIITQKVGEKEVNPWDE
ncbi:hypothetical protein [Martelella sp. AMO21009]